MIDPSRELARRAAVGRLKQRFAVTKRTFSRGGTRTRVLAGDVYFDVSETQLSRLRAGSSPEELGLDPSDDQED